jgi:hypothetical protein
MAGPGPGLGEGDECERLDINPVNHENRGTPGAGAAGGLAPCGDGWPARASLDEGDECERLDIDPVNRENGVCPAQVWPVGWRRAATGGRHGPGLDEGDECERLDIDPVNRENGVCPAQVWPVGWRRAATSGRHSHGRGEGDECEPRHQPCEPCAASPTDLALVLRILLTSLPASRRAWPAILFDSALAWR